jgi:hypothetical protein
MGQWPTSASLLGSNDLVLSIDLHRIKLAQFLAEVEKVTLMPIEQQVK